MHIMKNPQAIRTVVLVRARTRDRTNPNRETFSFRRGVGGVVFGVVVGLLAQASGFETVRRMNLCVSLWKTVCVEILIG